MLLCTRDFMQLPARTCARDDVTILQSSAYIFGEHVCGYTSQQGCSFVQVLIRLSINMFLVAGHYSSVQKERQACAISLIQADTLPEGFNWGQLPNLAGGLYLV